MTRPTKEAVKALKASTYRSLGPYYRHNHCRSLELKKIYREKDKWYAQFLAWFFVWIQTSKWDGCESDDFELIDVPFDPSTGKILTREYYA